MNDLLLKIKNKIPLFFQGKISIYKNNIIIEDFLDINVLFDKVYFIYIEEISKSEIYNYSGTFILNKLEKLLMDIEEIKYIKLSDASRIILEDSKNNVFQYSLATLSIMSSGMSWYNKYGYLQNTFQEDYINYTSIIERNFIQTIQGIYDNDITLDKEFDDFFYYNLKDVYKVIYAENPDRNIIIKKCIQYILNNLILFTITNEDTIKDIGNKIKNNRDKSDNMIYFKYIILILFESIFQYQWTNDQYLTKLLIR